MAHWTFDDTNNPWQDSGPRGWHARVVQSHELNAEPGVFGHSQAFRGSHRIEVPNDPIWSELKQISFSAWVLPVELGSYREIFRKEDGNDRVLFSFQNDGRILSLGLNINGYVECDAPIRAEDVLDGQWHHCAATFDGQWMRVFLDGRKIGELHRPGPLKAGGNAPACIASLNGGENFQGALDDLRIYDRALDESQVHELYRAGFMALLKQQEEAEQLLSKVYQKTDSFATTAANARHRLGSLGRDLPPMLPGLVARVLQLDFPQESDAFVQYSGLSLVAYLSHNPPGSIKESAQRLYQLFLEYRPLTEEQWRRTTAAERAIWESRDKQAEIYRQLLATNEPEDSPAWIEWILTVGPQIAFRPRVYEAVAPYVVPQTPETQARTSEEARTLLENDWLFQADGHPTVERIRQEIGWARELIDRLTADPKTPDLSPQRAALTEIEKQLPAEGEHPTIYFRVREIKREVMFKNPVVDFDTVLFIDQPYPQGSEWPHETRHRLGYMAVPGGRLLVLKGLSPDGQIRQLAPQPPLHGSFWRPDLSFDAKHVLFCFKPHNEKSFHLYETNLHGGNLRQLTFGPYDDFDPIYLSDGQHILFTTTRGNTYVRCMHQQTHSSWRDATGMGGTSISSRRTTSLTTCRA